MTREREEALYKFVERDISACQSSLIEEAFKKQLFLVEDVVNMYRPFDRKLQLSAVCSACGQTADFIDSDTGECETCFENNQTPQEIFEWWLVTPWLGKKLLLEGQPVLDNDYGLWWGRCTTGQAISMDYVIEKIYDDIIRS